MAWRNLAAAVEAENEGTLEPELVARIDDVVRSSGVGQT